jgi:hypothetical protein
MKAHVGFAILLGAAVFASSGTAEAADTKGFGDKYQLILSADRLIPAFSYTSASSTTNGPGNTELTQSQSGAGMSLLLGRNVGIDEGFMVNPHTIPRIAFDFTIIPKLTLGAALAFGFGLGGSTETETVGPGNVLVRRESDSPTVTAIGLAPRVGYIIPLTRVVAFWPRAGFAFYSVSSNRDIIENDVVVGSRSNTDTFFSIDLDPQFVFVPVEHFFFHVGPLVNIPLSGTRSVESTIGPTTNRTSNDISLFHFGIAAGLGGWISL